MAGFLFKDREYSTPIQFTIDLFGAVVAIWAVLQIGIFIEPKVLLGARVLQYLLPAVALAVALAHIGLRGLRVGRALRSDLRLPRWRITGRLAILWAGLFPATWAERSADRVFRGEWRYLATLIFCISAFYGFASINISDRIDAQQIAQEEIGQRGMRFSTESYRNAIYFQNTKSLELFHEAFGADQDRIGRDMFELTLSRPAPFTGRPMIHELIDRADCDDIMRDAKLSDVEKRQRCDARINTFLDIFGAEVRPARPRYIAALRLLGIDPAEAAGPSVLAEGVLDDRFALLNERGDSDFDWNGEAGNYQGDTDAERLAVSVLGHTLSRRAGHLSARLSREYGLTLDADSFLPAGAAPPDTPNFDAMHNLAVADPLTALQILRERQDRAAAPARLTWTTEELDAMHAAVCAARPGRYAPFAVRADGPVRGCDPVASDWQVELRALNGWTAAMILEPLETEPDTMLALRGDLASYVDDGTTRSARIKGLGAVALRDNRLFWAPEDTTLPLIEAINSRPGFFDDKENFFLLHDGAETDTVVIKAKKGAEARAETKIVSSLQEITTVIPADLLKSRLPLQVRARVTGAEVLFGVSGAKSDAPFRMRRVAESWREVPIPSGAKQVTLTLLALREDVKGAVLNFIVEEKTGLTCRPGPAGQVGPGLESETRLTLKADALGTCRFAVPEAVDVTFEASGFAPLDVDFSILRTGPYKPGSTDCATVAEAGPTENVLAAFGFEENVERVSGALDPGCYAVEWADAAAEVAAPFTMRITTTAIVPGATRGAAIPISRGAPFEMTPGDPLADRTEMWVDVSNVSGAARIVVDGFKGDIDLTVFDADGVEIDSGISVETPEVLEETDLTDAARVRVEQVSSETVALGAFTLRIE